MKHHGKRPDFLTRESPPKVVSTKKGAVVNCPFCNPTHPILPGVVSPCGTVLRVTAIQVYFSAHYTRHHDLICLKCGQGDGQMIRYRNGYVHMEECAPEKKFITEAPKLSTLAKIVFKMPVSLRKIAEKRFGVAKELQEIDEVGKETGKVLGYVFWKEQVKNA